MDGNWWDGMDLAAWSVQSRCLAGILGDGFAHHVARERARERGVRQRLTVEQPAGFYRPVYYVADVVEEPCS